MLSTSDWTTEDGNYNYVQLFNSVVALFETDPKDAWAVETLKWYQEYVISSSSPSARVLNPILSGVFGSANTETSSGSSDSDDEESEAAAILARRAARRTSASSSESG